MHIKLAYLNLFDTELLAIGPNMPKHNSYRKAQQDATVYQNFIIPYFI
jgi:hypothetical protein